MEKETPFRESYSRLIDDVWKAGDIVGSCQTWHFDAVSDDGREAVVVAFHDDYPFKKQMHRDTRNGGRVPAVSFVYSSGGRPVVAAAAEFPMERFSANGDQPKCEIGRSNFRFDRAEYGPGFVVIADLPLRGGRRVRAEMEWLLVESDLAPSDASPARPLWNIAAPRADVSGKIELLRRNGKARRTFGFRGTGYHDSICIDRDTFRTNSRIWGRAHFSDATLIFERFGRIEEQASQGTLILIRDGCMTRHAAECQATEHRRDRWGLRVPRRIAYLSDDNIRVRIRPRALIRSGIHEVKMLSEITLTLDDDKQRHTTGITEFIDSGHSANRVARILDDLRVAKGDGPKWF